MRKTFNFNNSWIFENSEVCLPHSAVELPFNYFDESIYQKEFTYEKIINQKASWNDKEVCLVFEAIMANAHIYLNDKKIRILHSFFYNTNHGFINS